VRFKKIRTVGVHNKFLYLLFHWPNDYVQMSASTEERGKNQHHPIGLEKNRTTGSQAACKMVPLGTFFVRVHVVGIACGMSLSYLRNITECLVPTWRIMELHFKWAHPRIAVKYMCML
jgi:hypothetical protein